MSYINFRIYDQNYIDINILANTDVSSEQSSFPVTNAYNLNRRSKVWRSNGYFNITSANNTIIFQEQVGVNLTATIPVAEYTSISSLITAIKDALDLAGTCTYTVSQSNLRFNIVSNGVGGLIFRLMTTNASFTAYDVLGYSNITDKTGSLSYLADYVRINTSEWILWDMGISSNPTAFFLIGDRNKSLQISPNAIIKLEANETNNFITPSFTTTLVYDDEIISNITDTGIATQAYRYWKLSFIDQNPNGYIQVGAFFLGTFWNPTRGRPQFPFRKNYIDRSETITSEGGQTYADIKQQLASYTVEFKGLTKSEVEDFQKIFNIYGTARPFFVSFDTAQAFSTDKNRRIKFVKFLRSPDETLLYPNYFSLGVEFKEEL